MNKIIALGGVPGSGKTTLMKRLIEQFDFEPHYSDVQLVPYLRDDNLFLLGKYEDGEVFGGTDKMSMAVQPHALNFINSLDAAIIIYEGDRLFGTSFLEELMAAGHEVKIFILDVDKNLLADRYAARGSNQNETWLAGRHSKVNNIRSNLEWLDIITILPHNTEADTDNAVEVLKKEIR